jgi:hypothetical protein
MLRPGGGVGYGVIESEELSRGSPLLVGAQSTGELGAVLAMQRKAGRGLSLIAATVESNVELAAVVGYWSCRAVPGSGSRSASRAAKVFANALRQADDPAVKGPAVTERLDDANLVAVRCPNMRARQ